MALLVFLAEKFEGRQKKRKGREKIVTLEVKYLRQFLSYKKVKNVLKSEK